MGSPVDDALDQLALWIASQKHCYEGKPDPLGWDFDPRPDIERLMAEVEQLREERDNLAKLVALVSDEERCPDCGIPLIWCRRATSNPDRCWRWDYEQFDTAASLHESAEARVATLTHALETVRREVDLPDHISEFMGDALAAMGE